MVFPGNPEYGVDLQSIDFVKFAEACGAVRVRIEDPKECGAILDRAINANPSGPVLIEAVVDPFEAPMPAKATNGAGSQASRGAGPRRTQPKQDRHHPARG